LQTQKYYKIEQEQYSGALGIVYPWDAKVRFSIGTILKHFNFDQQKDRISGSLDLKIIKTSQLKHM
jgi:hypothetical protein